MDNKEKSTAQMLVWMQPSLYAKFKKVCKKKYSSVSGMVKKLIVKCIEENGDK